MTKACHRDKVDVSVTDERNDSTRSSRCQSHADAVLDDVTFVAFAQRASVRGVSGDPSIIR